MQDMSNAIAVVIGAGSSGPGVGNGKATAIRLAQEGATVVCADLVRETAEETVSKIVAEGGQAETQVVDVTDESSVRTLISGVVEQYGRVDIVVNVVGVAHVGSVTELSEAEWDKMWALNLKGAAFAMKFAIPQMVDQGGGSIVNISSIASIRYTGVPYATYYATKAAMNHLTQTSAAEFARSKVRINAVLPGLMKTPMVAATNSLQGAYGATDVEEMWSRRASQVPMGEMGDAWDVAEAAVFLAGPRAKYVTGVLLPVDGGITLGYAQ